MIKASGKIICVFVDCDWGKKNADISGKYGVRGYPTILFTDPDGNEIEKGKRDAASLKTQFEEISAKYGGPTYLESLEKALEKAKEDKKPILYLFTNEKADSKYVEEALGDASLKELREKFVLAKSELKKDSADMKTLGVSSLTSPVLFILDPVLEKPESAPVKKLTGKKGPKELKNELESALKKIAERK